MLTTSHQPWNVRAFVTVVAAVTGALLPVTGVANHLLQSGSLTGPRHAWMAAHNALGVAFLTFAVWHVIMNRRAFAHHFRDARARFGSLRQEVVWAAALVAAVLCAALGHTFHAP